MTRKSDISTPEGYFDNLQQRLSAIPARQAEEARPSTIRRFTPYLAYAASLLVLVALGNFILRKTAAPAVQEDQYWDYYAYLADSLDPDGYYEYTDVEELSEEDILNYLLADNISLEQLAYYEEGY